MTKNKNSLWFLSGYGIALILLLYFGLNDLIITAFSDTIPNVRFITILALNIIVAWSIGLVTRRYLKSLTKDTRNKIRNSF
ncbi:hypothetical protein F7731_24200 [Cytobacillus depressus]|uniref:Uncharacterized protein n=1 Tax=Cytobacillus depressus TaxID=1602942 RepID=A0A6L3V038_9BACI|nr:hypothetical protein [Cytobacillus depressus]KAB2328734.1 hypothetical protein F7731_24200 [Cytobacillus depressus]